MSSVIIENKVNKCIVQVLSEDKKVKKLGLRLPILMEKLVQCNNTLKQVDDLPLIVQNLLKRYEKQGAIKRDKGQFILIGCPKPPKKIVSVKKKIEKLPPKDAANMAKRGNPKLTKSALQKERTDEVFKSMMLQKGGVDFKDDPKRVVKMIVPSDAPKLQVVGNALESISEGVITNAIPTSAINALDPVATEEVALTLNFRVKNPPEPDAAKKVITKRTPLLAEPNYNKNELLECEVLHDAFFTQTCFQAKGTVLPKWFPGYFTAFPEENPVLLPHTSPSFVLQRAWKSLQPEYMQ